MAKIDKNKIREEVISLKKKLLSLRMKSAMGELKDTSQLKKTKKAIAILLTKLNGNVQ